ncbi:hypothetical protein GGR26_003418 [Lewinella marina]|uniref:Uncharacterized protein n=1 Tax=Neolewinella marina TaxID=438751 RepID=A0A2G0CCI5_9BACT|nr:hypothetical protein [Neolewinella marina]NJB87634.1 hypothetical protein [Neolewinella marina]PHK97681.1 hypothetical protein CGL56_14725 [Neolewinella marina]
MNEAKQSYQQQFFERLSTRFTSRSALVQAVAEDLHVGRDAVYRRLRGDTALTADEMMHLAAIYQLRTDLGGSSKERVPSLRYPEDRRPITNEFDHFVQLHSRWEQLKRLPGASFDLASPELPIYYELSTPVLRAFKIFMFGITTWNLAKWKHLDFSTDLIDASLHRLVEDTIRDHYSIPARELWSIGVLDVTLRQVNYMAQIGKFADPKDQERIFIELHKIVDHLEAMVRTGKRFPLGEGPGPRSTDFRVYHNELSNTSNVVLVKSRLRPFLFTTLVNPNYVATSDRELCEEAQQWFDNLVEHGNALHAEAGKYAAQYFGYLRGLIRHHEQRSKVGHSVF